MCREERHPPLYVDVGDIDKNSLRWVDIKAGVLEGRSSVLH